MLGLAWIMVWQCRGFQWGHPTGHWRAASPKHLENDPLSAIIEVKEARKMKGSVEKQGCDRWEQGIKDTQLESRK